MDRLPVIGAGRVVADGSVADLQDCDGSAVRAVDGPALARSLEAAGFHVEPAPDGGLLVRGAEPA